MKLNKIYNMDCLEGLKQLEDNSIDLVLTDPPYGISIGGSGKMGGSVKIGGSKKIGGSRKIVKALSLIHI